MKKMFSILTVLLLVLSFTSLNVFAEEKNVEWSVFFNEQGDALESNFDQQKFNDDIAGMQPGDSVTFTLKLTNRYADTVDWYMRNDVIETLENTVAAAREKNIGGGYTYILTYQGAGNAEADRLFDSDTVGGQQKAYSKDLEGLKGATDSLKDFFYLDSIAPGSVGQIVLTVALDGETQGNDYQDTYAILQMQFAVELPETEETSTEPTPEEPTTAPENPTKPSTPPKNTTVVTTGELVHPLPLIVIAGVSGVILLILAILGFKLKRSERKEAGK